MKNESSHAHIHYDAFYTMCPVPICTEELSYRNRLVIQRAVAMNDIATVTRVERHDVVWRPLCIASFEYITNQERLAGAEKRRESQLKRA